MPALRAHTTLVSNVGADTMMCALPVGDGCHHMSSSGGLQRRSMVGRSSAEHALLPALYISPHQTVSRRQVGRRGATTEGLSAAEIELNEIEIEAEQVMPAIPWPLQLQLLVACYTSIAPSSVSPPVAV